MPSANSSAIDQMASSVRGFFDSVASHSKAVGIGLVAVLVLGAGVGFYLSQQEQKAEAASAALFLARQAVEKDLKAIAAAETPKTDAKSAPKGAKNDPKKAPPAPEPTADSVAYKKLDVEARLAEGVKRLQAVAKDFPGTRAAFEARLALGDLFYNHGSPAKAVSWYREASDSVSAATDRSLALYSLGYALENSNQPEQATQAYEKALSLTDGALKGDLLLALARTYELRKDVAKAKATYDQVLSQFPNTDYAKSAETFKAQLGN